MTRGFAARVLAPVGLATLLVGAIAGPAFACDPRRSDLRDPRTIGPQPVDEGSVGRGVDGRSVAPERAEAATPTAITPGTVDRTSIKLTARYRVSLTLRFGTRVFNADSLITITNTSGGPIDRVELNTIAARLGGMRLRGVEVDGRSVTAKVSDQTIIVPLGGVLAAGDSVRLRVRYGAHLRSSLTGSNWMFTRVNGIVDAYRWIPWVSRATPFTRPNHGDPFVTPISPEVDITVRTDRRLVIASTADRVSGSADGLTQRLIARNVRDVTITAAPDFRTQTVTLGSTKVRYYYRSTANKALIVDAAVDAFRAMRSRLGPYPYPVYKVVQSAGGYGMESPGLTWIPYGVSRTNLRYLVAHETAHQWFYGLVGNDQARQPFADEALAAGFVGQESVALAADAQPAHGGHGLGHDQLGGAFHPAPGAVHLLAVDEQHDIGVLLHRPQRAEVIERGARVIAVGEVLGELGHRQAGDPSIQGHGLERPQRLRVVFVLGAPVVGALHQLEVIHHHQRRLVAPGRRQRLVQRIARQREEVDGQVPNPNRRRAHGRARLVRERGAAHVVNLGLGFDGQRPLQQAILVHLAGEERHAMARSRRAQGEPQGQRRFAGAHVAPQHHQVAPAEAAPQHPVHRREATGDGVRRGDARFQLGVNLFDQVGERGAFDFARAHTGQDAGAAS